MNSLLFKTTRHATLEMLSVVVLYPSSRPSLPIITSAPNNDTEKQLLR